MPLRLVSWVGSLLPAVDQPVGGSCMARRPSTPGPLTIGTSLAAWSPGPSRAASSWFQSQVGSRAGESQLQPSGARPGVAGSLRLTPTSPAGPSASSRDRSNHAPGPTIEKEPAQQAPIETGADEKGAGPGPGTSRSVFPVIACKLCVVVVVVYVVFLLSFALCDQKCPRATQRSGLHKCCGI